MVSSWIGSSSAALASTTSRTSRSRSPATVWWSSPGSRGRASRRSPSTPCSPKASAATSSRCRPTPASSCSQMEKPDVDSIEGLSPAISIEQKSVSKNPRSTVGTVTEIHDYLRLLYASIGVPHCPELRQADPAADRAADGRPRPARCPRAPGSCSTPRYVRGKKGEYRSQLQQMAQEGLPARAHRRRDGRAHRRACRGSTSRRSTRSTSWSTAWWSRRGSRSASPTRSRPRSRSAAAWSSLAVGGDARGDAVAELLVRRLRRELDRDHAAAVLVQQPLRRLLDLLRARHADGRRRREGGRRPRALDRRRRAGAVAQRPGSSWRMSMVETLGRAMGFSPRHAVARSCPRPRATRSCTDSRGKELEFKIGGKQLDLHLEGLVRRRDADARAALQGDRLAERARRDREVHVDPTVRRLRRAPAAAARRWRSRSPTAPSTSSSTMSVADLRRVVATLELGDNASARSPTRWCRRSATASASSTTSASATSRSTARRRRLSGGESQRIRLATQIGSKLHGRALRARRAVDRPASARQRAPAARPSRACAISATRCWWSSTTRRPSAPPTG